VDADRRGDLEDPSYLETLSTDDPVRANENVFGFSLAVASLEVLQFLMLAVAPSGVGSPGPQSYHMLTGLTELGAITCKPDCIFQGLVATGESEPSGAGLHIVAEASRRALSGSRGALVRLRNLANRLKAALGCSL